jgi:hypothetical protein
MRDRVAAQRRADRIRAFRDELDALTSAGVSPLTSDQRSALDAYHDELLRELSDTYDVDRSEAAGQLSRGLQLATLFAAVTLIATVWSIVARFWAQMDLPLQATLLCAFPLASLVAVELAARREKTLYVASLFAVVACGTLGVAAYVLSDTMSIPIGAPVLWAGVLFALALALAYGFRFVLGLALLASTLAAPASVLQAAGIPWSDAIRRPELPMVAGIGVALLGSRLSRPHAGFDAVARFVGIAVVLLALLILAEVEVASLLPLSTGAAARFYQATMIVVCLVLLTLGVRRGWRESVALVAVAFTLFLVLRFTHWLWDSVPRYVFFLALTILAFIWIAALRVVRARLGESRSPT